MISEETEKNNRNLEKAQTTFQEYLVGNQKAIQLYKTHKTYRRIFTPLILLWCLIFQRLNHDHSCDAVVTNLRGGGFDHIEKEVLKAQLSQRCSSESTAGYCKARKRLPVEVLEDALKYTVRNAQSIPTKTMEWFGPHGVFIGRQHRAIEAHTGIGQTIWAA